MEVRRARPDELARCAELVFLEPSRELVALLPSIEGGRRMIEALFQRATDDTFLVAVDGDEVVGFAQVGTSGVSLLEGARAARRGFGLLGILRLVRRGRSRRKVNFTSPPGVVLKELHVDPARRGEGIGGLLLDRVIADAGGVQLSLTTRTDNPAQHLYERHGFAVVETKTDAEYERRTGATGRVLMVRPGTVPSS